VWYCRASEFADFFMQSQHHAYNCRQLSEMMNTKSDIDEKTLEALNTTQGTATPFWWALATLMWYRMFKDYRDPAVRESFLPPAPLSCACVCACVCVCVCVCVREREREREKGREREEGEGVCLCLLVPIVMFACASSVCM
jgi:hypothetical protein